MAETAEHITGRTIRKAKIIAVLFLLILIYPAIDQSLKITKRKKPAETKKVLTFPALDTNKLDSLPKMLDAYYSDKFILQDFLVAVNSYFKIKFLGVSPDPTKVIVGKDGWLFWAHYIDNFRGTDNFTPVELKRLKDILDNRAKWYRAHGIRFYFAPPPDKMTIYPEYLPSWLLKVKPTTMMDQVVELFKGDTLVPVIDMRKRIFNAKKKDLMLYFKIDHHWTEVGAFYGYLEIADRLKKDFPAIVPLKYEDFRLDTTERLLAGSESELINFSKYYKEYRYKLFKNIPTRVHLGVKAGWPMPTDFAYPESYELVRVMDGSTLPYIFVIRDSFADAMMDFLQENSREIKYIYDGWGYMANKEIVVKEKPDIVILMPYESNMKRILECDSYQLGNW
jgi:alginate O-acetyltransferase complex protein AlgJ